MAGSESREQRVRDRAAAHGQQHVFAFWDQLDDAARETLLAQVEAIDFPLLDRLLGEGSGNHDEQLDMTTCRPAPMVTLPSTDDQRRKLESAREAGTAMLAAGKVAVLTVAGGQGTRLGFDRPKGMFPIGPVTDRTLFQIFAEKIRATERRHGAPILWLVMTSPATHDDTVAYFDEVDRFGFAGDRLRFVTQKTMPAVDADGKLILASPGELFLSPNGHGGSLLALRDDGGLEAMRAIGADTLYYFQVDNPLVPVPDPVFLGYHHLAGAEMSTKVVAKRDPAEKVGVICEVEGRTRVIEYSDLDAERMNARDTNGALLYRGGNIAVHAFERTFIERLTDGEFQLPYHRAHKSIPFVDAAGRTVKPDSPNGIKFESFVFDALPAANSTLTQEVARDEEFAPVKNADGDDSPATSRAALTQQYGRWLRAAGIDVPGSAIDGTVQGSIEIAPGFALDAEQCAERIRAGAAIDFDGDRLVLDDPGS